VEEKVDWVTLSNNFVAEFTERKMCNTMDASFLSGEIASLRSTALDYMCKGWNCGKLVTFQPQNYSWLLAKLPESGAIESFTMCDQILGLEKDTQFPVASALAKTLAGRCRIG
jgi:hypothetical protein